jgi:hypothetical protein
VGNQRGDAARTTGSTTTGASAAGSTRTTPTRPGREHDHRQPRTGGSGRRTSYNFSITDNYLARNNLLDGPDNPGFPMPAIYISESGSDSRKGGVPACTMRSCLASKMPGHPDRSVHREQHPRGQRWRGLPMAELRPALQRRVRQRVQPSSKGGQRGPFSVAGCAKNLAKATLDHATFVGTLGGVPPQELLGRLHVADAERDRHAQNLIDFNPSNIFGCTPQAWQACGANGVFSQFGGPNAPGRRGRCSRPRSPSSRQHVVPQRLPRPVDVLRLEPGEPGEPGQLGRVDRSRRRGRPVHLGEGAPHR